MVLDTRKIDREYFKGVVCLCEIPGTTAEVVARMIWFVPSPDLWSHGYIVLDNDGDEWDDFVRSVEEDTQEYSTRGEGISFETYEEMIEDFRVCGYEDSEEIEKKAKEFFGF